MKLIEERMSKVSRRGRMAHEVVVSVGEENRFLIRIERRKVQVANHILRYEYSFRKKIKGVTEVDLMS